MKVCDTCDREIDTKDGENTCAECEASWDAAGKAHQASRAKRRKKMRAEINQVMRDCGMVKVRGAMGGVYWE